MLLKEGGVIAMNIAIVDDSASDRRHLEQILQKYAAINQLDMNIEHFSGGEAFLNHYQPYQYTIIFLDIFMNGITGIKTAEIIRKTDEESVLVFLTTSEDHRPEAFRYLLPPISASPLHGKRFFARWITSFIAARKRSDIFLFRMTDVSTA